MTYKECPNCGKEFSGDSREMCCPACSLQNVQRSLKQGKMPSSLIQEYKLLCQIYILSEGTGVFALKDWAYKQKDGKVYRFNGMTKYKAVPPILKLYRRGLDGLPEDVALFFDTHKNIYNALRYEGDPGGIEGALKKICGTTVYNMPYMPILPPKVRTSYGRQKYIVTSPEGQKYEVDNLHEWAKSNAHLFGLEVTELNIKHICDGMRKAAHNAKIGNRIRITYKKWKCEVK